MSGDDHDGLRGKTVLLVEDNEVNQLVATELLTEGAGMVVTVAASGKEALDLAARQSFQVVLMDVQLPDLDGYEITRRMRSLPGMRAIPIVALTAGTSARDREMCIEAGMNDFISKPFELAALMKILARWLAGAAPQQVELAAAVSKGAGVSISRGLHNCLGKEDLYVRIVRHFLEERANMVPRFRAWIGSGDYESAGSASHTLITTAATIGALRLSGLARAFNTLVAEKAPGAQFSSVLDALEAEGSRVLAELRQYLVQHGAASS